MTDEKCDLVLCEWETPPVPIATPILAKATGLSPIGVSTMVRRSQGVLGRNVEASKAEIAVEEFMSHGVEVAAVPSGTIVDLPHVWPLRDAVLLPDRFRPAVDVYGNRTDIPWSDVAIVAAASITSIVRETKSEAQPSLGRRIMFYGAQVAAIGVPIVMIPPTISRTVEEQVKTCALSFVTVNPLRHLRVEAGQFNYGYLGERLSDRSVINFTALVTDALQFAATAATNLSPEEMKGIATQWPVYANAHDLERRLSWMLWRWNRERGG